MTNSEFDSELQRELLSEGECVEVDQDQADCDERIRRALATQSLPAFSGNGLERVRGRIARLQSNARWQRLAVATGGLLLLLVSWRLAVWAPHDVSDGEHRLVQHSPGSSPDSSGVDMAELETLFDVQTLSAVQFVEYQQDALRNSLDVKGAIE